MTKPLLAAVLIGLITLSVAGQSTEFTYQGRLLDGSLPPTANYDFQFSLWDSLANGTQAGATQTITGVAVTNGIFTVRLNFGDQFTGAARFLQIATRPTGGGTFTTLAPRQPITSGPYAIRSLNSATADTATNSLQLGGVAASQYVVTTDLRMTDDRNPQPGSANYIQNQNVAPQSSSNFNVSGTGTANIFSATTQYNIGTNRVLSVAGVDNVFVGIGAGSGGVRNSFFGRSAGFSNTFGQDNSFFGSGSGSSNTTGFANSFFGVGTGGTNTTGDFNSFFGFQAGLSNTTTDSNSFFGASAGFSNTTGGANSFFGRNAGNANTTGNNNSFFGADAGQSNTGGFNSFFGRGSGANNTTGGLNSFFGGRAGANNTTGGSNSFFGFEAGQFNTDGGSNSFFGGATGNQNTTGSSNSFFGSRAGLLNTTGSSNSFFGYEPGLNNTTGSNNTMVGGSTNVSVGNLTFATAIGSQAIVIASNQIQLGRQGLDTVRVGTFNAGGPTQVCVNNFVLTFCSSSLRYKENVQTLGSGLNLIERLRPVTFDWKDRKEADLGLIAEEVAEVEPLLVIRNDKGVIEGVKYNQISAVLINAVKEQQVQIVAQQRQIDELKKIVCSIKPDAEVCK